MARFISAIDGQPEEMENAGEKLCRWRLYLGRLVNCSTRPLADRQDHEGLQERTDWSALLMWKFPLESSKVGQISWLY
jgi:hypothetical protein